MLNTYERSWGKEELMKCSGCQCLCPNQRSTESHQELRKVSETNSSGQGQFVRSMFAQNQAQWGLLKKI